MSEHDKGKPAADSQTITGMSVAELEQALVEAIEMKRVRDDMRRAGIFKGNSMGRGA